MESVDQSRHLCSQTVTWSQGLRKWSRHLWEYMLAGGGFWQRSQSFCDSLITGLWNSTVSNRTLIWKSRCGKNRQTLTFCWQVQYRDLKLWLFPVSFAFSFCWIWTLYRHKRVRIFGNVAIFYLICGIKVNSISARRFVSVEQRCTDRYPILIRYHVWLNELDTAACRTEKTKGTGRDYTVLSSDKM